MLAVVDGRWLGVTASKRKRKGTKGKPIARRVLMQPPQSSDHAAWALENREGMRSPVKTYPIVRLTADGPDDGTWPQPGDEVGYGMEPTPKRGDDCLAAAIATALQHPIEQVPDLRLDKRIEAGEDPREVSRSSWERIARWAEGLGLELTFHEQVPADRRRWIGVCPDPKGSWMLGDHCLVMSRDRLVFDPSVSVKRPPGMTVARFSPSDIAYGISFDRKD
jgi:hypothetical protein